MKPAVFFRSCGLTAVLLAGAVNSYGQPHNDRVDYGTSLLEAMKIEDSHHAAWKAYFDLTRRSWTQKPSMDLAINDAIKR